MKTMNKKIRIAVAILLILGGIGTVVGNYLTVDREELYTLAILIFFCATIINNFQRKKDIPEKVLNKKASIILISLSSITLVSGIAAFLIVSIT